MLRVEVLVEDVIISSTTLEAGGLRDFIISNVIIKSPFCTKDIAEFRKETEVILDKLGNLTKAERGNVVLYGNDDGTTCLFKTGNRLEFIYCYYEQVCYLPDEDSQTILFIVTEI